MIGVAGGNRTENEAHVSPRPWTCPSGSRRSTRPARGCAAHSSAGGARLARNPTRISAPLGTGVKRRRFIFAPEVIEVGRPARGVVADRGRSEERRVGQGRRLKGCAGARTN